MKCKLYISDEGFGPVVRESAVISEIKKLCPNLEVTVQTQRHEDRVKRAIEGVLFKNRFNNIQWAKKTDGSPDIQEIQNFFSDYLVRAEQYIQEEKEDFSYDFVISDCVPEAFRIARECSVPSFGIAHFTWDWFFSKIFPCPVSDEVMEHFSACTNMADTLFFPPFTPPEILNYYQYNAKQIPLIVRKNEGNPVVKDKNFKVLIMDSGSSVIASQLQEALDHAEKLKEFHFYVSSKFTSEADNVTFINPDEVFTDYIPYMDLVVSRAGFNTISECIAFKTPILMTAEVANPEMAENMLLLKKEGLGSIVDIHTLTSKFDYFLSNFVENEYKTILNNMQSHGFSADGAIVVAKDIISKMEVTEEGYNK